jgi:aminopeptidase 2
VAAAKDMFVRWVKGDKAAIHPDLRSAVFGIALKNGGKAEVWSTREVFNGGSGRQSTRLGRI